MEYITAGHVRAFQFVRSPQYDNVTLSSCRINGEPGVAIITLDQIDDDKVAIMPLFVGITPGMDIVWPGEQRASGAGCGPTDPREAFEVNASSMTMPAPQ